MNEKSAVDLVPELDRQKGAVLGRPVGRGTLGHAEEGPDGRLHARVRIPPDQLVWDPSVIVMPHGGSLELELIKDDLNTHCALLPSNGDNQFLWLPNHSRGTANLTLDGPECYLFSSPIGNDEGRGLTGDRRARRSSAGGSPRPPRPAATLREKRQRVMAQPVGTDYLDAGQADNKGR